MTSIWEWLRSHGRGDPTTDAAVLLATYFRDCPTAGTEAPPVDVDGMASWLGVEVLTDGTLGTSATLDARNPRPVIRVFPHPDPIRRFALAHELGHLLLHPLDVYDVGVVDLHADKEREANRFAAALLLPAHLLYPDTRRSGLFEPSLAGRYGVSTTVLTFRLKTLGLIP